MTTCLHLPIQPRPASATLLALACAALSTGCQWIPLNSSVEPEPVMAVAPWVSDPTTYYLEMQELPADARRKQREQALVDFLVQPDATRQLRLNLLLTASHNNLDEAQEVASSLSGALAQDYALPPEAAAYLASESLRLQQRVEQMEEADNLRKELAQLGTRYRTLQRSKASGDAALRAAGDALKEAQEKLEALTAIEKSLESTNGTP